MGPEQVPDLTDKSYIDPSIDPKVLIEQEGENVGRISAAETSVGETTTDSDSQPGVQQHIEQGETVEGLPVIGAEAENYHRDDGYMPSRDDMEDFKERSKDSSDNLFGKVPGETTPEQMADILHDNAGTEAMALDVKSRAVELAKKQFPLASQELIDQFGQKASEKFVTELESKNAEKKAEHNKGVQALIDSLDSPDTPLSSIVPEPESESDAAKAFR